MHDRYTPYGEGCWSGAGIIDDPTCEDGLMSHAVRGADFTAGLASPAVARRGYDGTGSFTIGLRCRYEDAP
jgi:hypothetical protein